MRNSNLNEIELADLKICSGSSMAIFVHWSKDDVISKHDINLINALALEFEKVLVVRNLNRDNSKLNTSKIDFQKNIWLLHRANVGYDFGAYKKALNFIRPASSSLNEILLMNNSVYKLKVSLNPLMEKVRSSSFDVTAITNSLEDQNHLQSYFLHLKKNVVDNNNFWDWFENLNASDNKRETVDQLEIPFANRIESFGLTTGALWDFNQVLNFYFSTPASWMMAENRVVESWIRGFSYLLKGEVFNPTHYMWAHLLELNCPFLKKDLLHSRDFNVGIETWSRYAETSEIKKLVIG